MMLLGSTDGSRLGGMWNGMGAGLGQWPVGFLEVPNPRLLAHFYQDARAEG